MLKLADNFLNLTAKNLFENWNGFVANKILDNFVHKSYLCARREKSGQNFGVPNGKIMQLPGIFILVGYLSLPS